MQNNFKKIPFFILIIFLFFLVFAFLFLYRGVNSNGEKAAQTTIDLENEISRRDEIKALNRSIDAIKGEKADLETHFAKSSDIVPFLDTIEALAPRVGAKAQVTSVDILKDNSGLMVQISASGSFASLYKFLTLLENSPYELEFTGVDIQRQNDTGVADPNAKVPVPVSVAIWQAIFRIKLLSFVQ
jgi:hypothetical protein